MRKLNNLMSFMNNRNMRRLANPLLNRRRKQGKIAYSLLVLAAGGIAYTMQRKVINRGAKRVWRTLSNRTSNAQLPTAD